MNYRQWKKWTLPSKLTAIGTIIGIISFVVTILIIIIDNNQKSLTSEINSKKDKQTIQPEKPFSIVNEKNVNNTSDSSSLNNTNTTEKHLKYLNRLKIEEILQKKRDDIERCIEGCPFLALEFVFSYQIKTGINLDIYAGGKNRILYDCGVLGFPPEYKDSSIVNGYVLLSYFKPKINGCIISALRPYFENFQLPEKHSISHTYITNLEVDNYNSYKGLDSIW
jgi:hypothetical protein